MFTWIRDDTLKYIIGKVCIHKKLEVEFE